ncbi:hypothetical protein BO71DRAFT_403035 [Aspergillus ellipticus CBS 707.79]|uniref:Uncharacterized protein n=1 Tax=Aspergillus ellipticus CBS 707.79 TaxID=1448320 RepID=A0A319D4M5_9EURO|nr:hypothetical protein BO71DRAFT_403035 [Aspergillus ellipticus CBS 707.79]
MLLTLKPSQNGVKGPHEYSIVRQSVPTPRSSPPSAPDLPAVTAPPRSSADHSMDSSRSGLPPPASLTLPPPNVGFADVPGSAMNHPLPPPPGQWQTSDESMRQWLQAKAEEDRRKQEEEKTRQEALRLEQRRVEQSMLRDSLQAGVPPQMIPLIFAGITPGGLPPSLLELTQQHLAQPPPARAPAPQMPVMPHTQRRPPHARRDSRTIPPNPYVGPPAHHQTAVPPPGVLLSQPLHTVGASPTSQPLSRPPVANAPVDHRLPMAAIPRMNPGEAQLQPSQSINLSNVYYAPGSSIPSTQPPPGKSDSSARQSPPSLYFHHWVPPGQPPANTSSGRPRQESPGPAQGPRRLESQTSPGRKRKAHGPHQPAPLPSSHIADSQTSQPGSPVPVGRSTMPLTHHHHHAPSQSGDASASYDFAAGDVKRERASRASSPAHSPPRRNLSADDEHSKVQVRMNDRERSDGMAASEDNIASSPQAAQAQPGSSDVDRMGVRTEIRHSPGSSVHERYTFQIRP